MVLKEIFKEIYLNLNYLKIWQYQIRAYNHLKKLKKLVKSEQTLSNKTIVINTVRLLESSINSEVLFGLKFALKGANVKILLDDGKLIHWDTIQVDNWRTLPPILKSIKEYSLNPYYNNCKNIKKGLIYFLMKNSIRKALKSYFGENLEYIYYSDILKEVDIKVENINAMEKHAKSSTIRFFRNIDLDYNSEYVDYYYKLSLKNGFISKAIGEYVLKFLKPDLFITPHGYYSTHGPTYEFLKENGVNCRIWINNSHAKTPTVKFIDTMKPLLSRSNLWQEFKSNEVDNMMKDKVQNILQNRFNASTVDMKMLKYIEGGNIVKVNKDDGYKYHIAMFPNVLWDSNIQERHNVFDNILDWLFSTIEFVKKEKSIKLYIKVHPGEVRFARNTPGLQDILRSYYDIEKIENIEIIPAEIKTDTYEFLKSGIDLSIVYDGILGLEIPFLKIPTIICVQRGFSSVDNGNYVVLTKEQYFHHLKNINEIINDFSKNYETYINNIIRYLYWYMFVDPIKFSGFNHKARYNFDLLTLKKEDLIFEDTIYKLFK